jgi:type III secretion system (T3SS) inner membrane Yop/YscD-like protein
MDAPHIRIDTQSHSALHVLSHPPRVTLEIVRGRARRLVRRVTPPVFLIGAAADCDLVLAAEQFPEAYAYVYVTPDGVSVRHLGARPALLVNGEPVESARLDDGDRLEMGPFEFAISIVPLDPRGGGIRAHDDDGAKVPYDLLGLDAAAGSVRHLLAEIRQSVYLPPVDLRLFDPSRRDRGPTPTARRPLAGYVARRASA